MEQYYLSINVPVEIEIPNKFESNQFAFEINFIIDTILVDDNYELIKFEQNNLKINIVKIDDHYLLE